MSSAKGKRKMEKAERSKALSSPDALPIVYTDLRRKVTETKPLAEFLEWAKEEKVLIFTKTYHDLLFSKGSQTEGKSLVLCPSIENHCTTPDGIAEVASSFYADRHSLFADNMYKGIYQKPLALAIDREKRARAKKELLESERAVEAASKCDSSKIVDASPDTECSKAVDDALECQADAQVQTDASDADSDIAGCFAKGQASAHDACSEGSGVDAQSAHTEGSKAAVDAVYRESSCTFEADADSEFLDIQGSKLVDDTTAWQAAVQWQKDAVYAHSKAVGDVACDQSNITFEAKADCGLSTVLGVASDTAEWQAAVAQGQIDAPTAGGNIAEGKVVDADECITKQDVGSGSGSVGFDTWLLQLEKGKKAVAYDQILIQLLKSCQAMASSLKTLDTNVSLMRKDLNVVHKDLKVAHKAISDNGESIVRVGLAQYLQQRWGSDDKRVSVPIFGRRLPFVYWQPLEALAKLCLTSEKKGRSLPTDVDIDVFVKVVDNGKQRIMCTPPRAPYKISDELTSMHGFTSFLIGENTRSGAVCNDAYLHPLKADYSKSTKLLYKFIQVERALIAAKEYYYVDESYMEAALIVSPSFKNLSNAHELIDQVLAGRVQAFRNIAHLHADQRMWLTSL